MSITLDKDQQHAADELIAVTGDKTVVRTWDLADAIAVAIKDLPPRSTRDVLNRIRQSAVDKAGHDEFWGVNRLKQMGRTAETWGKADRIPDVSLDAHMEAYRKSGDISAARKVILTVKQKNSGKATIRQVRAELGANGTTAQPPRIDKAGADEIWRRLTTMPAALKKHLRGRLKADQADILAFAALFNELAAQIAALTQPQAAVEPAPADETVAPAVRKTRRKGM